MTVLTRGGVALAVLLLPPSLHAQAPAQGAECRADSLSGWNCARFYSGTISFRSELVVEGQAPQRYSVTATVTAGRVVCRVESTDTGRFEEPGMLAVAPASTGAGGEYEILLWCPDEAGQRMTREHYPVVELRKRRAGSYTTLEGTDRWEHPDADAVNGVSGTESVTWNLRRS